MLTRPAAAARRRRGARRRRASAGLHRRPRRGAGRGCQPARVPGGARHRGAARRGAPGGERAARALMHACAHLSPLLASAVRLALAPAACHAAASASKQRMPHCAAACVHARPRRASIAVGRTQQRTLSTIQPAPHPRPSSPALRVSLLVARRTHGVAPAAAGGATRAQRGWQRSAWQRTGAAASAAARACCSRAAAKRAVRCCRCAYGCACGCAYRAASQRRTSSGAACSGWRPAATLASPAHVAPRCRRLCSSEAGQGG
jgi:hypothetical protein